MRKLIVTGGNAGVLLLGALLFFIGGCGGVKPKPVKKVQVAKPERVDTSFLMENLWGLPPLVSRPADADAPLPNLENEEWMKAFQSEGSPEKAYHKLKGLMERTDPADYHSLFESFSRAAAFQKHRRRGKEIEDFIKQWSGDALRDGSDARRFYYSAFYHRVRHMGIRWMRFRTLNNLLQPGDTLHVRSVQQFNQLKPKDKYNIRVERKLVGKKGTGYRSVAEGPLQWVQGRYGFSKPLVEPGTYRISIYNSHFFQQMVISVTGLRALVKNDSATLAIWAYSPDPNLNPPYDVTVFFDARHKVDVQTDSTGLVALLRSPEDKTDTLQYQAVIRKGSHSAYVEGEWGGSSQGQSPLFLHVTSDREAYQPGDTLHYYALWRWNNGFDPLPSGFNDSLAVELVGGAALLGGRLERPDSLGVVEGSIPIPASTSGRYNLRFSHRGRVLVEKPVVVASPRQGGIEVQAPKNLWEEGDTLRLLVSNPSGTAGPRVVIRTEVQALGPDSPESFAQFQDTLELSPAGRAEWKKIIPFYANAQAVFFQVIEADSKTGVAAEKGIMARVGSWCRVQWSSRTPEGAVPGQVRCLGLGSGTRKSEGDLYLEVFPDSGEGVRLPLTPLETGSYGFALPEQAPGRYRAVVVDAQRTQLSAFFPVEMEGPGKAVSKGGRSGVALLNGPFRPGDTARVKVKAPPGSRVLISLEDGKIRKMRGAYLERGEHLFEIPVRFQGEARLNWAIASAEGRDQGSIPIPVRPPPDHPNLKLQLPPSVTGGDTVLLRMVVTDNSGDNLGDSLGDSLGRGVPAAFQLKLIPLKNLSQLDTTKTLPGNHVGVAEKTAVHSGLTSAGAGILQMDRPLPGLGDKPSLAATYQPFTGFASGTSQEETGWQEVSGDVRWVSGRVPGSGELQLPVVIPPSSERCLVQLRGAAPSGTFFISKLLQVEIPPEIRWRMPTEILEGESVAAHTVLRGKTNGQNFPVRVSLITAEGEAIWDSTAVLPGTTLLPQAWTLPLLKPGSYRLLADAGTAGSIKATGMQAKEMKAKEMKAKVITRPFTFAVVSKAPESLLEYSGAILSRKEESSNYFQLNFNRSENTVYLTDTVSLKLYGDVKELARDALESALGDWPHHYLSRVSFFLGRAALNGNASTDAERRALGEEVLGLLSRHQNADGGWSWGGGSSDLLWTVWCGRALMALKSAEPKLWGPGEESLLSRACDKIRGLLSGEKDDNAVAYGIRFLTRAGKKKNLHNHLRRLEEDAARLSSPALIFLWETLLLMKAGDTRTEVPGTLLKQKAFVMPSEISYGGDARSPWFGSGLETTARALRLFAQWDLESPERLEKMVAYLCRNRTREHWGTLKSTAVVAEALALWWDKQSSRGGSPEPYTGKVFFNGAKFYEFGVPSDTSHSLAIKIPLPGDSVKNRIVLGFSGKGSLFYGASASKSAPVSSSPAATPEPSPGPGRELSVERSVHRLKYRQQSSGGWRVIREPWSGEALQAGEELEVKLTVNGYREHRDLLVSQAVPTAMRGLHKSPQWYGRWLPGDGRVQFMESGDGVFRARVPRLEGREARFRFVLRAEEGGRVYLPPARVQSFLNPSLSHQTESAWINIKEDRP